MIGITKLTGPRTRRAVSDIAAEIRRLIPHGGSTWIYCRHWVDLMDGCTTWDDPAGQGFTAAGVGAQFLYNAGTWRGRDARRLKLEIRDALAGKV